MHQELPRAGRRGERLKQLRRNIRQRPPGEVIVDGRRLVEDLVRWGVPIRELYLADGVVGERDAVALAAAAHRAWVVDDAVLADVSPTRHPQGVLGVTDEPQLAPWPAHRGIALFLDGVQDPGNLGAIIRSAAGLGAGGVFLSPDSADPFHPATVRGSAGAVFRIPVQRGSQVGQLAERVKAAGGEVWATGADGTPVATWQPEQPVLLLLGAEGRGLSEAARAWASGTVTIPLDGELESLNVAVAAGVLLQAFRGR